MNIISQFSFINSFLLVEDLVHRLDRPNQLLCVLCLYPLLEQLEIEAFLPHLLLLLQPVTVEGETLPPPIQLKYSIYQMTTKYFEFQLSSPCALWNALVHLLVNPSDRVPVPLLNGGKIFGFQVEAFVETLDFVEFCLEWVEDFDEKLQFLLDRLIFGEYLFGIATFWLFFEKLKNELFV